VVEMRKFDCFSPKSSSADENADEIPSNSNQVSTTVISSNGNANQQESTTVEQGNLGKLKNEYKLKKAYKLEFFEMTFRGQSFEGIL
jgi:hypothetical protein